MSQQALTSVEASRIPSRYRYSFSIEQNTYHLYTYSYLGFGAEKARETLRKGLASDSAKTSLSDPCLNKGYTTKSHDGTEIIGAADSDSCISEMKKLFSSDKDSCSDLGPHSFQCVHQPDFIRDSPNFLVFENFYYISSALGLHLNESPNSNASSPPQSSFPLIITPARFLEAARRVCDSAWTAVQGSYPLDDQPKVLAYVFI